MLNNGESGIDCGECGHKIVVKTHAESQELQKKLEWQNGDPVCPECGRTCWFEDYLD